MQKQLFPDLGIDAEILKAIEKLGFAQPSPIQAEAIPVALAGRDVVGQSQTGSGKTMAFAIPGLQAINPKDVAVQMLVMCPTRELAMQVCTEIHKLLPGRKSVFATPIYGGAAYEHQIRALKKGSQIVVGTPGRILDFVRRGTLKLGGLKMLVFDEADEMLDMGFRDEIQELVDGLPEERQTIFFSATVSDPVAIGQETEFILDIERANVAFSRTKRRLIVLASRALLDFVQPRLEHYQTALLWKHLRTMCSRELVAGELSMTPYSILVP